MSARMRVDSSSVPVMICDVSSHGLLLRSQQPPPRGAYIEVVRPGVRAVARVVWTSGASFGVQTRDWIDVGAIAGSPESALEKPACLPEPDRKAPVHAPHHREASEWLAGRMQFVAIAAAGLGGALLGGLLVFEFLTNVSTAITAALH